MSALIIGAGGRSDRNSIPLSTRAGRRIDNELRMEHLPARMQAAERTIRSACPGAQRRSLSARYNCMGMVFASRRVWVDIDAVRQILEEDGYFRLPRQEALHVGDVVLYNRNGIDSHVGILIGAGPLIEGGRVIVTVLSQFGADGEYIHPLHQVPLLCGQPSEFWTDRRVLL